MVSAKKPLVVKTTSVRLVLMAVAAGAGLLGFIFWGIFHMSQEVSGHSVLTGKIVGKHFQPQVEQQITVGQGGLDEKNLDGIYTMDVRTGDGHNYTVFVEKPVYESHQVGDDLTFLPPPAKIPATGAP